MAVVNAISGDRDDFRGGCGMGSHVGEESEHGMIRAGQGEVVVFCGWGT
jgi:hypothetical protein